ncbi:HD domain-containing phosphohydrolase [Fusibacter bizertensis]
MISLKKTTKGTMVGIVIFIIVALSINFLLVPISKDYIEQSNAHLKAVNAKIISMDLPVKVLNNILTQVTNDASNKSNVKLLDAFENNQKTLYLLAQDIESEFVKLQEDTVSLNKLSLMRHEAIINRIQDLMIDLKMSAMRVDELLRGSDIDNTPIDVIENYAQKLSVGIEALNSYVEELNDKIIRDFTFILNAVFIILILFLIIFSIGVYKFVTFDQQFVLKSFLQLERHQYDFSALPQSKTIFSEQHEIAELVKEILDEANFTKEVKDLVSEYYHMDDLIESLFGKVTRRMGVDRVGIAFVDYSRKKFIAEYGVANYGNVKLGPGFEVNFDKTTLVKILYTKEAFITDDLEEELKKRPHSASLILLRNEGVKSNIVVPLIMGEAVFGVVFFSSSEKKHFDKMHLRLAEKVIYEISGLLNRSYFTKVVLSRITNSFSELVDQKDNETGDHILRMVKYSVAIAEGLRKKNLPDYPVNRKFVLEIERNASSHDIGKVGIPDSILKKPGKLTPEEWQTMKTHAKIGADIFKSLREGLQVFESDFYVFAEEIARHHHERWDGTGYPDGLAGFEIPLSARIVAIADVFDALSSKRAYKEPFSFERSVEMIKESAGNHLDPVIVDVFVENLEAIWTIYQEVE